MKKDTLLKLEKFPYFSTTQMGTIALEEKNTLKKSINRFLSNDFLIQLKKGTYVTKKYINDLKDDEKTLYYEFISSVLKTPSYLSLEYVLTKYDLLTESSYIHTAITTKNTAIYNNSLGVFKYQNIKEDLFDGYELKYFRDKPYYIATIPKALFDFIYFRKDLIHIDANINLVEEFRIKTEKLTKKDWLEIEKYGDRSNNNKVIKIIENFKKYASDNN